MSSMSQYDHAISTCSLDQLIGLCDEISGLVKAGIPLEEALLHKGAKHTDQFGKKIRELAEEVGTGKPLAEFLQKESFFPPVYSAVIEAGIESGNLAGALDTIAENARQIRDARGFLFRTLLYPLVLFTTLWVVFICVFLFIGPRLAAFFEAYQVTNFVFETMKWCSTNMGLTLVIAVVIPILLWGCYLLWMWRSSRGTLIQSAGSGCLFSRIPWIGKATLHLQKTTFAKLYGMLIDASVPLDRAVFLAAQATDKQFQDKSLQEKLREKLTSDPKDVAAVLPRSAISPLIKWSFGIPDKVLLTEGLRQYADISQVRATSLIERAELFIPGIVTFCMATLVALCYLLTIVWPYGLAIYLLVSRQG